MCGRLFPAIKITHVYCNGKCRWKSRNDAYQKEYREKNKEKITLYDKAYQIANKERIKAYKKEYLQKNREKHAQNALVWYHKNKEKVAMQRRLKRQALRENPV